MTEKYSATDSSGGRTSQVGSNGRTYRRLVEASDEHAIFSLSTDGVIESWPSVATRLYGYDSSDILGDSLTTLYADTTVADSGGAVAEPTDDSPVDMVELQKVLSEAMSDSVQFERWHKREDGSVFWATTTVSPVGNGSVHGFAVVVQDTTAQKQYERMLERQNDRLKEFTGILSHDLRSPLAVIEGRLDLYQETGDDEHLSVISETTTRMERLIEDLLRVAKQGEVVSEPEPTRLEGIIETAREGTVPSTATLEYDPIPTVIADGDRLIELFENLFRNAIEHGSADVTIRLGPLDDGFYVEDDGPGIDAADRQQAFDHGFTTNEDGTGFGLSVVRTIVGAHGWDVAVTDSADGGARFEISRVEFTD